MIRRRTGSYLGGSTIIRAHPHITKEMVVQRGMQATFAQDEFDKQQEVERTKRLLKLGLVERLPRTGRPMKKKRRRGDGKRAGID
jgi:hypothetical protein